MKLPVIVLLFLFASTVIAQKSIADYMFEDKRNSFDTRSPALTNLTSDSQTLSWLDATFGIGGKIGLTFGESREIPFATAIQPDGKILVAGEAHVSSGTNVDIVLARFNPDGTLDPAFNGNGKVKIFTSNTTESARDMIIQPDGKILIGGYLGNYFCLARFNPDGSPDTSFDGDGITTTPILNSSGQILQFGSVRTLSLLPDGRIVAVGGAGGYIAFARYNSDGSPDNSFDGDGRLTQLIDGGSTVSQAIMQPDGKFMTVGWTNSGLAKIAVSRFNSDGSFDQSFGTSGSIISYIYDSTSYAWGCALQPDGKIVVVGEIYNAGYNFLVLRFNPDGSFDTTFSDDGMLSTDFIGRGDRAVSVVILPGGKILVGGYAYVVFGQDFALARYDTDGTLDGTFGDGGKVTTDFSHDYDAITDMALQPDGKLIATGYYGPNPANSQNVDFGVARYLADPRSLTKYDFDGDGKTDISIYRPLVGEWWYLRSSDDGNYAAQFGASSDKIVPADFTGDGKTDIAIWRPSTGEWFILRSEDGSYYSFPFGTSGDIPAVGDFDTDGKADQAVFRPSDTNWYIRRSSDSGFTIQQFGAGSDVPAVADYDGDGKSDIAIWRASVGEWWIKKSSNSSVVAFQFGNSSDKPVQGDYTGDGKADVAIWRPSTGEWFILRSEDFSYYSFPFGTVGDIPAPGDYDGDGKFDATVFRPSDSNWYIQRSTAGTSIQGFGQSDDMPVPNAFVP